ncbi:YbjN domain-containing protein [Leptolyngbya sp. 15MV]|nr:YbjN domain-containing protein [Leptolyngbya sp. 15MV]
MGIRRALFIAVGCALVFTSAALRAQTIVASDPQTVVAALQASGLETDLIESSDGSRRIDSSHDGIKFVVFFFTCDDDERNCKTLQFFMGYTDAKDTTLEQLNEWNRTKRFTRAYRDADGDPVLEMDVDTDMGGVPDAWFREQISVWLSQMDAFHTHLFPQ